MPTREQLIEQYGGWDNLPGYLKQGFQQQDDAQERREQEQRDHEEAEEAERARLQALRRPPINARLVPILNGRRRKIVFEHTETVDELPPLGYWVSEEYNGGWTKHGDYIPATEGGVLRDKLEATLFGMGPARVETVYDQMKLREFYYSPIVHAEEAQEPSRMDRIVAAVRSYTGRRTRDGRPWLYPLRRHAGIDDISDDERNEASKLAAE